VYGGDNTAVHAPIEYGALKSIIGFIQRRSMLVAPIGCSCSVGYIFFQCRNSPTGTYATSLLRFLDHTHTHTHTHLRTSSQLVAKAAANTTHNKHSRRTFFAHSAIRIRDPSSRAAADLRHRPHGHRLRPSA